MGQVHPLGANHSADAGGVFWAEAVQAKLGGTAWLNVVQNFLCSCGREAGQRLCNRARSCAVILPGAPSPHQATSFPEQQ